MNSSKLQLFSLVRHLVLSWGIRSTARVAFELVLQLGLGAPSVLNESWPTAPPCSGLRHDRLRRRVVHVRAIARCAVEVPVIAALSNATVLVRAHHARRPETRAIHHGSVGIDADSRSASPPPTVRANEGGGPRQSESAATHDAAFVRTALAP
jgi:hypothetical protein